MKRLCICLCCVVLALTACGRAQTALQTETVPVITESDLPQTQTDADLTEAGTTELPTETLTEAQTEPVTTGPQVETTSRSLSTTAAGTTQKAKPAQKTQTTRETHTLFTTPVRTTGTQTSTATTTATRPTTTKATTTTTTTMRVNVEPGRSSGGGSGGGSGGSIEARTPDVTSSTVSKTSKSDPSSTTSKPNPSSTTSKPEKPTAKTCTVTIDCRELLERPEKLKVPEKLAFVPKNGYIVKDVTMEFQDGESVYDVLRRVCATQTCTDNCKYCQAEGIQMESTYTPQFDNYYVEGIHQLYEKDCGGTSGWTYWVNGVFPNYGSSSYMVKPGDRIVWVYSIEMDANESFE